MEEEYIFFHWKIMDIEYHFKCRCLQNMIILNGQFCEWQVQSESYMCM